MTSLQIQDIGGMLFTLLEGKKKDMIMLYRMNPNFKSHMFNVTHIDQKASFNSLRHIANLASPAPMSLSVWKQ